ncbi:MAG TPA: hypothetical protein DCZ11_08650, partial [Gammaproteobacteria bacterium]|nr:hypothetical protein [Gammaproteobacteria bacterium]MCH78500.1 hypothetical protein [Gammaproteobacteria bacterium]
MPTLSVEQTVGGVACVDGDRVLVAVAAGSVYSGIWVVRTSAWERAQDFDGTLDVVTGTIVLVESGAGSTQFWTVKTTGVILPGTTSISIEPLPPESVDAGVSWSAIYSIFDGVLTAHATMAAAATNIGSDRCTVVVRDDTTMAASATFPSTAVLEVQNNARITTTGYTLTVNGRFVAPRSQCFAGAGTVTFGSGTVAAVLPEWFGAIGDDSTDNTTAIQAAANAAGIVGVLDFGPGTFRLSTVTKTMTGGRLTQGFALRGAGRNVTTLKQTGSPTELVKFTSSSPTTGHASAQLVIERMTLQGITGGPTAYGLTLESVADVVVRH